MRPDPASRRAGEREGALASTPGPAFGDVAVAALGALWVDAEGGEQTRLRGRRRLLDRGEGVGVGDRVWSEPSPASARTSVTLRDAQRRHTGGGGGLVDRAGNCDFKPPNPPFPTSAGISDPASTSGSRPIVPKRISGSCGSS